MRHQSIKLAAEELCITPQAASHQVKQLEGAIGQCLFERHARGIEATVAARVFFEHVRRAFDAIDEGVGALEQLQTTNRLGLHVSPYFASHYLIPNLNDFTHRNPRTDLSVSIGADLVDFTEKSIDVAIHWGYGGLENVTEIPIMDDLKVLVCRPDLLREKPIRTGRDLLRHNLICPLVKNTLWPDTLRLLGVTDVAPRNEMRMHTASAMLEATLAGLGIGLASQEDARREIELGHLVAPFGEKLLEQLPAEQMPKFYILLPKGRPRSALVETFLAWVQEMLVARTPLAHFHTPLSSIA